MATFTVNGKSVTVEKNQKLIRFLRDELHLTSVKDGCSEGACGTCHVLIDGKPTKACIPQTDKLEGKTILTVEGLTRLGKAGLHLRLRRGRRGAVRLLHPRHGHLCQGAAGREPRSHPRGGRLRHPQQYLPLHRLREDHRRHPAGGEDIPRGQAARRLPPTTGRWAAASTDWTWRKRSWATASIPMTFMWTVCATAVQSAASMPAPAFCPSTPAKAEALPGVICVAHAEGYPRQGQRGPSEEGPAHPDRRGRAGTLPGRQLWHWSAPWIRRRWRPPRSW